MLLRMIVDGGLVEPLVDPDEQIDRPGGRGACRPDSQ